MHHASTSARAALTLGALLFFLAACDDDNHRGDAPVGPGTPARHVAFSRANLLGGTDLFQAPIDATSPPVRLTDHGAARVFGVHTEVAEGRLLYAVESGGEADFWSVEVPQDGSRPAKRLTQFGGAIVPRFGIVGRHLVIVATTGGAENVFAVRIDGSALPRNLTQNADPSIDFEWDPLAQIGDRFAIVRQNYPVQGSPRSQVFVLDLDAVQAPPLRPIALPHDVVEIELSLLGVPARPLLRGETFVLRATDSAATEAQFFLADVHGSFRALTPVLPAAAVGEVAGVLLGQHLVLAVEELLPATTSLFSVDLEAALPTPQPTLLHTFPVGSEADVRVLGRVPGRDQLVVVAAERDLSRAGGAIVDLWRITPGAPLQTLRLTNPALHTGVGPLDIGRGYVLGSTVVFERASSPGKVWRVSVDTAASEELLLPSETRAHSLDRTVIADRGAGAIDGFLFDPLRDPFDLRVDVGVLDVVDEAVGVRYTNYHSLQPAGATLRRLVLTANTNVPDSGGGGVVHAVEGRRIVHLRSGALFSADVDRENSELRLSDNALPLESFGAADGARGGNFVFFVANGQLWSNPVDRAANEGRTRRLSDLAGGEQLYGGVSTFGYGLDRVVYSVTGPGGTRRIVSSPVDPSQPRMDDVSRTIDTQDSVVLLF